MAHTFSVVWRMFLPTPSSWRFSPVFFQMFYSLAFTFRSLIHLKLIFVYGVMSEFTFSHVEIQFSQHFLFKWQFFLHWILCQKSIDLKYKGLFLSIQLYLYIYPYASVYYWLWFFWNSDGLKRVSAIGHMTLS